MRVEGWLVARCAMGTRWHGLSLETESAVVGHAVVSLDAHSTATVPRMVKPDMTRPTARHHDDVADMPRDLLAAVLRRHLDHLDPEHGDRVRVEDGITEETLAEGTWTDGVGDGDIGRVQTADGTTFLVPEGSRIEVVAAAPRSMPLILTGDELYVAAELAAELAAVYDGEPLGAVADELARRIQVGLLAVADGAARSGTDDEHGDLVFVSSAAFDGRPVIAVHHEPDGDWQFLTAGPVTPETAVMAHLDHVWALDAALVQLQDLPRGYVARRPAATAPWVVEVDGDDDDSSEV